MKTDNLKVKILLALFCLRTVPCAISAPQTIVTYQGRVQSQGTNFTGLGQFKFALVTSTNSSYVTYWSNDGTSIGGSEPAAAVFLEVADGLFALGLGDTSLSNMAAMAESIFATPDLHLRLWFNDGLNGSAALDPPQPVTSVPRAAFADSAPIPSNLYLRGLPSGNGQALTNLAGQTMQPGTLNSSAFDPATARAVLGWTSNAYPILNPKTFGAYCDLVHNDSSALSNALYSASLNHGVVLIPKPGLLCRDPIWMGGANWGGAYPYGNVKLMGADANTCLFFNPNSGSSGAFLTLSNASLDIENLFIRGPGKAVGNWSGIVYTNTGGGFVFRNLTFSQWSGYPFINEIRARVTVDSVNLVDNAQGIANGGFVEGSDWKVSVWGSDVAMDNNWASSLGTPRSKAERVRLHTQYCTNGFVAGSSGSALDLSGFHENWFESLLDVGHNPARMTDTEPPGLIWFHDSYGQGGQAPPQMVRLWAKAAALTVSRVVNEAIVGATTNSLICSSNAVADLTPVAIENCSDANLNLLRFSNGQVITGTAADRDYVNMPFRFFNRAKGGTNQLLALNDGRNALTLSNNVPVNSDGANLVSSGFAATANGYSAGGQQGISAVLTVYGSTNVLRLTVAGGIIVDASYAPLGSAAPAFPTTAAAR